MTTLKPYHIVNQRHRSAPQLWELRRASMQGFTLSGGMGDKGSAFAVGDRPWLFHTHQKK